EAAPPSRRTGGGGAAEAGRDPARCRGEDRRAAMSAAGKEIDFYFEFSSPYGYIAAQQVDDLGRRVGRQVNWRPMLLGPVFKLTGGAPLVEIPMKGDYSKHDFVRTARRH